MLTSISLIICPQIYTEHWPWPTCDPSIEMLKEDTKLTFQIEGVWVKVYRRIWKEEREGMGRV